MKVRFTAGALAAFAAAWPCAIAQTRAAAVAAATPVCAMRALRFAISDDSPGMGHIGILMSLRNASTAECTLPNSMFVTFRTAENAVAARAATSGNISLVPGAFAYAHATWSDGNGGNTPCAGAVTVLLTFDHASDGFSHAFPARICASGAKAPSITPYAFSLTKEPVPVSAASAAASP